jgi:hypothetical protein
MPISTQPTTLSSNERSLKIKESLREKRIIKVSHSADGPCAVVSDFPVHLVRPNGSEKFLFHEDGESPIGVGVLGRYPLALFY